MINLQNNFLKLYEEMNQLWESEDTSIPNTNYDFRFLTIVQKALDIKEGKEPLDIEYWCKLREILLNKYVRPGDIGASTWYGRFLSFYKTYRVECALKDWFNNVPELGGVLFKDGADHHSIWAEDRAAEPDFKTGVGYTIECKEYKSDSSIHGADFVIRHAPADQLNIYFCLVGKQDMLKKLFKIGDLESSRKRLPRYVYCLDNTRKLDDAFSYFPVAKTNTNVVEMKDYKKLDDIKEALKAIDEHLEKNLDAAKQKATLILDDHTKQISKVIEKSAPEGTVEKPDLPSKDLDTAVDNLKKAADILADNIETK